MGSAPEKKKVKTQNPRPVNKIPRIDKSSIHDTYTRGELMRFRDEEAERMRSAKTKRSKN
jgi:hypothetical protein